MKQTEVIEHSRQYILQSKTAQVPYTISFQGIDLLIHPNVFPTATDTRLLAEHIHLSPTDRFLDITTGCGAIAVIAGLQKATGVAVDINPMAIKNAQVNLNTYHLSVLPLISDMFEKIPDEKFDVIFCNPPYYDQKIKTNSYLDFALYGGKKLSTNISIFGVFNA